ncbi:MAG: peptidase S15, partial [Alphaproteobacteria bacterium]
PDAPAPRALPAPPEAPPRPVTTVRPGWLERGYAFDLTEGVLTHRTFIDGGVFGPAGRVRLDDTGTELGDVSERIHEIRPDDPLSATARMEQQSVMARGDWQVRIETASKMTATATEFVLEARVTCWEGEEQFHHVDWTHRIPRNGM